MRGILVLMVIALVSAALAAWLTVFLLRRFRSVAPTPITSKPPPFDPSLIQRAPFVALDSQSLDAFVRWVAGTPVSDMQAVRDAVAAARTDDSVARALTHNLFALPVGDLGYHLTLLSIMGEMRRDDFLEPFVKFLELPADRLVNDVCDRPAPGSNTSYLDAAAVLKARAVEMLGWLRTTKALEAVLKFASEHDTRTVRLAALDTYLYNHEDSSEALERARAAARPEEAKLVGLPRWTRDGDRAQFDSQVAAFYERHPEDRPPPVHAPRKAPRANPPRPRGQAGAQSHA